MSLRYDFDICPGVDGALALFRDRATVEALRGADADVRAYFAASGFGLHVFDSGYAPGTFPAHDQMERMTVIDRLSANLGVFDLGAYDMNGFDFTAFLDHLETARAADDSVAPNRGLIARPRDARRVAAILGVVFLTLACILVLGGGALAGF